MIKSQMIKSEMIKSEMVNKHGSLFAATHIMKLKPLSKIKEEEGQDQPSRHPRQKKVRAGRNRKGSTDPDKSTAEGRK